MVRESVESVVHDLVYEVLVHYFPASHNNVSVVGL